MRAFNQYGYMSSDQLGAPQLAYGYDWSTGTYRNNEGGLVSWYDVKNNYIMPNATTLYSTNTNEIDVDAFKALASAGTYAYLKALSVARGEQVNVGFSDGSGIYIATQNGLNPYLRVLSPVGGWGGSEGGIGYSGENIFLRAWAQYQLGGGENLHVSTSSLDFSFVSQDDLKYNAKNNTYSVNLFSLNKTSQTSLALGKVSLNPVGKNLYTINPDKYDFNIEWDNGFSNRNIGTLGAGLIHGPTIDNIPIMLSNSFFFGGSFQMIFHGTIYIKP
jgi:hypothetical protein